MVPDSLHDALAKLVLTSVARVIDGPPCTDTYYIAPSSQVVYPTQRPSGEKKGETAPSVPGIATASIWPMSRR